MKKTLALILAVVIVFALATTAFAANTQKDIVGTAVEGTQNHKGTYYDGLTEGQFDAIDPSVSIAIKATAGSTQHRYAVDIDYPEISFNVAGGNLTWDVNELEYVTRDDVQGVALENQSFYMTITNRSDLPVYLTAAINYAVTDPNGDEDTTDGDDYLDGMDLVLYKDHIAVNAQGALTNATDAEAATTTLAASAKIEKATIGNATVFPFSLVATSSNWNNVVNYYMSKIGDGTDYTIATLSVALSATQS